MIYLDEYRSIGGVNYDPRQLAKSSYYSSGVKFARWQGFIVVKYTNTIKTYFYKNKPVKINCPIYIYSTNEL